MKNKKENKTGYIIGIDGGGTKTLAVLADLKGRVLKEAKTGPSNFIKDGIKETVLNITKAIEEILKKDKKGKILSTFIALSAIQENREMRKVIMKNLLLQPKISRIFQGKVIIDSDQIAAFCSGTDKKNGIILISGTGSAAHGWQDGKEVHVSGWGWLSDEGSGFWVGQKAYQAVLKDLDGRGEKTLMTDLFLQKFNVKSAGSLKKKIYFQNDPMKITPYLASFVMQAAQKKDKIAKEILIEAGKELALTGKTAIKKLALSHEARFSLVLTGGMFKSKTILNVVKKEIKKKFPKIQFIQPKQKPIIGAVKLALEQLKK